MKSHNQSVGMSILFSIVILILFFQNLLQSFWPIFNYFDEFISIIFLAYFILEILSMGNIRHSDLVLIIFSVICIFCGLIGNYLSLGQGSPFYIVSDIVSTFRFLWLYIGLRCFYNFHSERIMYHQIFRIISGVLKFYVTLLFLFAIINLFKDVNMSYDVRYGLRSFSFIYGTPGLIINQMTYALIIFLSEKIIQKKRNNMVIVMVLLVMLSTLRSRAFALALVFLGLMFFIIFTSRRFMKLKIVTGALIVCLISYSQFAFYFLDNSYVTPRRRFVDGALLLMRRYNPFGSGFATFGSSAAAQNYSNIYDMLGFRYLRGMGPTDQLFLNDNYFQMIFGQLGILGAIIFIIILFYFARDFLKSYFLNCYPTTRVISGFVMSDIFLSSIQSSYLAHYSVIALLFIGIFCIDGIENTINSEQYSSEPRSQR